MYLLTLRMHADQKPTSLPDGFVENSLCVNGSDPFVNWSSVVFLGLLDQIRKILQMFVFFCRSRFIFKNIITYYLFDHTYLCQLEIWIVLLSWLLKPN